MPPIIKVCGITRPADAVAAAEAGATALGLIFHPGSPRAVRMAQAAMIASMAPASVLKVGVFVNEDPNKIRTFVDAARLDVVQLHGDETPSDVRALDGYRLWKAVRVGADFDPESLADFQVEAFLLDTASESYGGAGRTFPWDQARGAKKLGKVILAGGLAGDNVADAIRAVDPWGVDASSRLESQPGEKDPLKVREYVAAAIAAPG